MFLPLEVVGIDFKSFFLGFPSGNLKRIELNLLLFLQFLKKFKGFLLLPRGFLFLQKDFKICFKCALFKPPDLYSSSNSTGHSPFSSPTLAILPRFGVFAAKLSRINSQPLKSARKTFHVAVLLSLHIAFLLPHVFFETHQLSLHRFAALPFLDVQRASRSSSSCCHF